MLYDFDDVNPPGDVELRCAKKIRETIMSVRHRVVRGSGPNSELRH